MLTTNALHRTASSICITIQTNNFKRSNRSHLNFVPTTPPVYCCNAILLPCVFARIPHQTRIFAVPGPCRILHTLLLAKLPHIRVGACIPIDSVRTTLFSPVKFIIFTSHQIASLLWRCALHTKNHIYPPGLLSYSLLVTLILA